MQDWGLAHKKYQGEQVLQRFEDNILASGSSEKVVKLQQTSCQALAGLFSSHLESFDVGITCLHEACATACHQTQHATV